MSEGGDTLRDVEVAVTGRLASMPREEAVLRIAAAGGRYVEEPGETTALLVVGEAGPPLGEDGRLTAKLRRAGELQAAGAPLAVVREEELLARLGLAEHRAGLRRLFTTAQLGRILGVPQGRIRSWVRHGLIQPVKRVRRLEWFDFAQVTSARKLLELTAGGVTPARLRKSLEQLHAWCLGAEPSLAQLERLGSGGPLLVRLDDGSLVEPSGQLVLDWDEEEAAGGVAEHPAETSPPHRDLHALGRAPGSLPNRDAAGVRDRDSPPNRDADGGPRLSSERAADSLPTSAESNARGGDAAHARQRGDGSSAVSEGALSREAERERWYETGVALEEAGRLERAARAYGRALAAADPRPEIHFNLGNVVYALERPCEAADHFFQAIELDPDYVEAWNNLGNALADLDRTDDALGAYRKALAIEPRYADAHYNLAQLLIRIGSPHTARAHLLAYLAEDPASSWAAEVRRILAAIR